MGKRRASVDLNSDNMDELNDQISRRRINLPSSQTQTVPTKRRMARILPTSKSQVFSPLLNSASVTTEETKSLPTALVSQKTEKNENENLESNISSVKEESIEQTTTEVTDTTQKNNLENESSVEKNKQVTNDKTDSTRENIEIFKNVQTPIRQNEEDSKVEENEKSLDKTNNMFWGNLFNQPFTNPFSKVAHSGEQQIFTLTATTSNSQFKKPSVEKFKIPESGSDDETVMPTVSHRPSTFPGEEAEAELYSDPNIVLFKRMTSKKNDNEIKFRRQGEGILRILHTPGVTKSQRIIIRQKGTWALLLNTPSWIATKFEKTVPGNYVKFVGLDGIKEEEEGKAPLCAFCLKFENEMKQNEFLQTVNTLGLQSND